MTNRSRLPNRRDSSLIDFEHNGSLYSVGYSLTPDAGLGELFVSGPKIGSDGAALVSDAAVLISIAVQHGLEPQGLLASLAHLGFGRETEPTSVIGRALEIVLGEMAEARLDPTKVMVE